MPSPAAPDEPRPPAVRYRCRHVTRYDYGEDVPLSHHLAHLTPRPHPTQRVRSTELTVDPAPAVRADHDDVFGNPVTYFAVQEPHRALTITARHVVDVLPPRRFDPRATPAWDGLREESRMLDGASAASVAQHLFDSAFVRDFPALESYAAPSFPTGRPVALAAIDLMERLHREFTFDPTATTVATPLAQVMENRRGVCQDFAHALIGCLRAWGVPARYVSGYLRTYPPPGQPRLVGADVSHAWVSVWCGGDRWLDLCPTNGRLVDQDYITLAWGRDYDDVSPVRGVILGGAGHGLWVEVDVEPVNEGEEFAPPPQAGP